VLNIDIGPRWNYLGSCFAGKVDSRISGSRELTMKQIIADALHGDVTEAFWTGTSYMLASAVVQPLMAQFSDVFGRRCILVLALCSFTIGSVVCSIASNFTFLLVGRAVQGLGGGSCVAMTHLIITDIIPLRQRPAFQSLLAIACKQPVFQ